ncbi:MAG: hypothetical protein Q4P18_07335 [Methanobrevibacter sp.]|uniref:hypothetical protein n=1 Tax=Methanobrevibacter sp. TaxID=66852 RepID=UPI0026DEEEA2|nr:hypothetical protein [Methanobrevibacter sp.]MDO5849331.1 hypothetical protein [Methanobrevibacter sp.]
MNLDEMQKKVDQLFKENNYQINDEILELQIRINEERNKLNIPDTSEFIFENFVQ